MIMHVTLTISYAATLVGGQCDSTSSLNGFLHPIGSAKSGVNVMMIGRVCLSHLDDQG